VTDRLSDVEIGVDSLLETAPCGFVSFTDDGAIRVTNAMLRDMLGYTRDELAGIRVESLFNVGTRIFYQTHFFPLLKLYGRADGLFLLLRAKSGEDIGVLCNAVRRERGGEWISDCILMRVTERQKFEDALLRSKKEAEEAYEQLERQALELEMSQQQLLEQAEELETQGEELRAINDTLTDQTAELERQRAIADEANKAKSAFLATMSHELRTPLNAIGGYVQLLELGIHGPITDAQANALGRVMRSQRHLLRLINDVLNLARIEAGRVDYTIETCALREIVDAVVPMVEPQLQARRIRYAVNVAPELTALADRDKAHQIVLNLLSNATKFTPADGLVTIDGFANDGEPAVHLRVSDTGIGIPAPKLAHVFEPFVQVDDSAERRSEGSGLGLAISRDLARGMGGDLSAESQVDVGSTFTLTLPRAT
jgi:PAS domain S-box-containing protein